MSLRIIVDPAKIAKWMEERGGAPARSKSGGWAVKFAERAGDYEAVEWEDFEEALKDDGLVVLVDEEPGKTFCTIYGHR